MFSAIFHFIIGALIGKHLFRELNIVFIIMGFLFIVPITKTLYINDFPIITISVFILGIAFGCFISKKARETYQEFLRRRINFFTSTKIKKILGFATDDKLGEALQYLKSKGLEYNKKTDIYGYITHISLVEEMKKNKVIKRLCFFPEQVCLIIFILSICYIEFIGIPETSPYHYLDNIILISSFLMWYVGSIMVKGIVNKKAYLNYLRYDMEKEKREHNKRIEKERSIDKMRDERKILELKEQKHLRGEREEREQPFKTKEIQLKANNKSIQEALESLDEL